MDTDLFQILALILLLGLLLTLFGVLQSLGAIRKTLEGRGVPEPAATRAVEPASAPPAREANQEPETWARGEASEPAASGSGDSGGRTGWPAPQEAAGASTSTVEDASSSPAAGSGARVLYGDAGLTTATPSEAALRPGEAEPADTTAAASAGAAGSGMAGTMGLDSGMGTSGGGTDAGTVGGLETGLGGSHMGTAETDAGAGFGTVETDAGTSAGDAGSGLGTTGVGAGTTDTTAGTGGGGAVTERAASADDDPQEQPFERDGRWWFRRGDELLVYEEQTGQWVAADEPSSSGSVATEASAPAETQAEPAPSEGQVTTQQEAVGTFWKCPSCGAVNGSTATSCRMCFTARP